MNNILAARYITTDGDVHAAGSTPINFSTRIFDPYRACTIAPWVFYAPHDGYYSARAYLLLNNAAWLTGEYALLQFWTPASNSHGSYFYAHTNMTLPVCLLHADLFWLNKGDYLSCNILHTHAPSVTLWTGANANRHNRISVFQIG